jgi:hypothetical protein
VHCFIIYSGVSMVIAVQRDFGFGSWICSALFTRAIAVGSLTHLLVLYRPVFYSLYFH